MHILLVDDHPVVRKGMAHLLTTAVSEARVSEAGSVETALSAIELSSPDAIVLDLSLGRESGLDLIRRARDSGCRTPILVVSVFDEVIHAERVIRAGAQGYLMKESAPDLLVDAVRRVYAGEVVLSPAIQAKLVSMLIGRHGREPASGLGALTERELEVLGFIGHGLSTSEIAGELSRSIKTIETHRANIQRKLGLDSATQLLRYAIHWAERGGAADQGFP